MPEQLISVTLIAVILVALVLFLNARKVEIVYPPNVGLLYRNGRFQRESLSRGVTHSSIRSSARAS